MVHWFKSLLFTWDSSWYLAIIVLIGIVALLKRGLEWAIVGLKLTKFYVILLMLMKKRFTAKLAWNILFVYKYQSTSEVSSSCSVLVSKIVCRKFYFPHLFLTEVFRVPSELFRVLEILTWTIYTMNQLHLSVLPSHEFP